MLNQLPLNSIWGSLGASFEIVEGWWIPERFRDFQEEYKSILEKKSLADFSYFGKVKVTGNDRTQFLHNILTQDIKALRPGTGALSALLSAGGKVLMLMEAHAFQDYFILIVETGMAAKTIQLLDKFVITEDVALEDVTADYALLETQIVISSDYSLTPLLGTQKFLVPNREAEAFARELIFENSLEPVGYKTMEVARIEKGVPRYGIDIDENVLLPETGLESLSVSGTKGCYPGQEVVARIETYKGLNRKLMGLILESPVPARKDDKIIDIAAEKDAGRVTSCTFSPALGKYVALGYLTKDFFAESREVLIQSEKAFKAVSVPLPFRR